MDSEKILVIGGMGLIGSKVTSILASQGHAVTIFDNFQQFSDPRDFDYFSALSYRKQLLSQYKYSFIRGDSAQTTDLLNAFHKVEPDRVMLLAAVPLAKATDEMISNAVEYSVTAVSNILQIAAHFNVKRFLYTSSSLVYGEFQYSPCDEQHPCNPRTIYGSGKLAGELLTRSIAEFLGIPYTIVRPISVYGPGDINSLLSTRNLQRAIKSGIFPAGSLESMTDWTYVDDTADGLCRALMQDAFAGETFNIARGCGRTLSDIIQILNDLGYPIRPGKVRGHSVKTLPKRGSLSIEKAKKMLGFSPSVDLEEGLARCMQYVQEQEHRKISESHDQASRALL
ncbi:MAG TPA: NAD(P)-dependent oxidoreductase [Ktedonosporobacter sp.]|jgi:nucleoside-diphosphate-sugar epimerase|nr:NAD(P)-dependent oxidoreductase [Ktedonosporobacter sp.]